MPCASLKAEQCYTHEGDHVPELMLLRTRSNISQTWSKAPLVSGTRWSEKVHTRNYRHTPHHTHWAKRQDRSGLCLEIHKKASTAMSSCG